MLQVIISFALLFLTLFFFFVYCTVFLTGLLLIELIIGVTLNKPIFLNIDVWLFLILNCVKVVMGRFVLASDALSIILFIDISYHYRSLLLSHFRNRCREHLMCHIWSFTKSANSPRGDAATWMFLRDGPHIGRTFLFLVDIIRTTNCPFL